MINGAVDGHVLWPSLTRVEAVIISRMRRNILDSEGLQSRRHERLFPVLDRLSDPHPEPRSRRTLLAWRVAEGDPPSPFGSGGGDMARRAPDAECGRATLPPIT